MTDTTPKSRPNDEQRLERSDIASKEMGRNSLQGNDQEIVHNQRRAVPDVKTEADGVVESFRKLDKDTRAREDLGKGNKEPSKH